jgi:RimJ/RimL family protein N-acetyltransferase
MEEVKFRSLSSKRLILRKPVLDDAREIFNLRSNEQVNQYLDRQVATSIEDAVTFIEKILAIINKNEGCYPSGNETRSSLRPSFSFTFTMM